MARHLPLLAVLTALLGLTALLVAQPVARPAAGHVYTVAELRALLRRAPHGWAGRTVWLAAQADRCAGYVQVDAHTVCAQRQASLVDPGDSLPGAALLLAGGSENRLFALLGRLPLLGRLVPGS
jgi:hypothetical protein